MKYTIHGFSQKIAIDLGLDNDDLLLLRWLTDFSHTGKMSFEKIGDNIFYWVQYEAVCEDLPIIATKKDTLYRRLKKICSSGVLLHHTVKNKFGTYSYYAFGNAYYDLISEGYGKKSVGGTEKNPEGVRKKIPNKDQSINNNPSTKDPSIKPTTTDDKNFGVVDAEGTLFYSHDLLKKEIQETVKGRIYPTGYNKLIKTAPLDIILRYLKYWSRFEADPDFDYKKRMGIFINTCIDQRAIPLKDGELYDNNMIPTTDKPWQNF